MAGDDKSSIEQKIDWNDVLKQTIQVIKDGRPSTKTSKLVVDFFPAGAKAMTSGKHLGAGKTSPSPLEIVETNLASAAYDKVFKFLELKGDAVVGSWELFVDWDLYQSETSKKTWIKDLNTRVNITHTVPGTTLDIKAAVTGQSYENEPPRITIEFTCDYSGIFKNTSYSRTCKINGLQGVWSS